MFNARWKNCVVFTLLVSFLAPVVVRSQTPVRLPIRLIHLGPVQDVNGQPVTLDSDPSIPLYIADSGQPLRAPDGHQVTLGEWIETIEQNKSFVLVRCTKEGTNVTVKVTDLLPNALYTAWLFVLATSTSPIIARGMPTVPGHRGNDFTTDASGGALLNTTIPASRLEENGSISSCLMDNLSFLIRLAYHSDNQLYCEDPGPSEVTINHISFVG